MMYFLTVGLDLFLETQFVTQTQSCITITLFTLNYTLVQRETWNSLLQKDPDRAVRSCVSHSNILISLVRRAPVLSRRHAISNSTDLTCVITCSERLWPVQQHLSSPDQSNTQHFDCRRLHTAIWRHLREQSRFQASRRVMSYVSMCGQYGGLTDQLGVWHVLCLQQRHNFQLFGFVSPPLRLTWEDLTGYNCPRYWVSPQTQAGSPEATSDCNLWTIIMVSECSRKTESQNFKNIQLWRSNPATILSNDGLILLFAHKLQEGSELEKLVWDHLEQNKR